jgi:hypothetical protein
LRNRYNSVRSGGFWESFRRYPGIRRKGAQSPYSSCMVTARRRFIILPGRFEFPAYRCSVFIDFTINAAAYFSDKAVTAGRVLFGTFHCHKKVIYFYCKFCRYSARRIFGCFSPVKGSAKQGTAGTAAQARIKHYTSPHIIRIYIRFKIGRFL